MDLLLRRCAQQDPFLCVLSNGSHIVQDSPNGYPRFAAFLESDEKFMIYRQFGYMQARLLLEKQAILSRLETKLQNSDWDLNDENPIKLRTSKGHSTERKRLLDDIETTWLAYSK